jgi:hypothetical protein
LNSRNTHHTPSSWWLQHWCLIWTRWNQKTPVG